MRSRSRDPIFGNMCQRSRSLGHTMYAAKICVNYVLDDYPLHTWVVTQLLVYKLPWQHRLPSNGPKVLGFMTTYVHHEAPV